MTYHAGGAWWQPFLFIAIAGFGFTYVFRFIGVWFGGRLRDDSELLILVRAIATALVAAVIGNLVVYPSGPLAATPFALRIVSVALGFVAYLTFGRRTLAAILIMEAVLAAWFVAA